MAIIEVWRIRKWHLLRIESSGTVIGHELIDSEGYAHEVVKRDGMAFISCPGVPKDVRKRIGSYFKDFEVHIY